MQKHRVDYDRLQVFAENARLKAINAELIDVAEKVLMLATIETPTTLIDAATKALKLAILSSVAPAKEEEQPK